MFFWFLVLGAKFAFAYFLQVENILLLLSVEGADIVCKSFYNNFNVVQIRPLVKPTRIILDITDLRYSWHDFVSKSE